MSTAIREAGERASHRNAAEALERAAEKLGVPRIRADFPILSRRIHGKPLVYLDNAATTQKPRPVLDAVRALYEHSYANVHRGVHLLSVEATDAYEAAREKVRQALNAREAREIVFVRGTTEGINLVAQTYGRRHIGPGDEVLISVLEHHSNIVPWQLLCEEKGARLAVAPIDERGEVVLEELEKRFSPRTRLLAISHVSNALGTVNPIERIVEMARNRNVPVLVDGAQAVPRLPVDVQRLGCDFYAFSSHKAYGPTGTGVLYGRSELLEAMPPYQGGGDMISSVTFEKTTWNVLPYKFEAGTPNIAGAIGLGAALDYLGAIGLERIADYEKKLLAYATEEVSGLPGLRIIGQAREKAGALSFVIEGIHPHDIGTVLDREGIAVRTGHHCAQPVMDFFGVPATARASLGLYNTRQDIDALIAGLRRCIEMFRG
jgi:cysteine desulfurase/selenocysteine lyase